MLKLAYILFLQICLLTISYSYGNCAEKRINSKVTTESVLEALTPNKAKFEKALSDSSQFEFILSEDTFETNEYSSHLFGSPLNLNGISLSDYYFIYTEGIKLNNQGLLERNIIPFRNISRNILFHNLQIRF